MAQACGGRHDSLALQRVGCALPWMLAFEVDVGNESRVTANDTDVGNSPWPYAKNVALAVILEDHSL